MTTHHIYEERLEKDLDKMRHSIAAIVERIETALENAVRALLDRDLALAYRTILGDNRINRNIREIDRQAHFFVARHLPSAGHLRFISSVLRMTIGLERIGDYAVTICREAVQLSRPLDERLTGEAELMAKESREMLRRAVRSFNEKNVDLARESMAQADKVEHDFTDVFEVLVEKGSSNVHRTKDLMGTLVIFYMLERVSDQAKNICEETVFAVTGQTKKHKKMRILFLDEADDCRGQMAVAIARKAFPNSGSYTSLGREPAAGLDPVFCRFMEKRGYSMDKVKPGRIDKNDGEWKNCHIIVSLEGPYEKYVAEVPFHTTALVWEVPEPPVKDSDENQAFAQLEVMYKDIASKVRDLMETLRGEEAS